MDATEQDIALANKAAMAAAMGGAATDATQDAPRRERGERGRRNDRRGERQDFGDAGAEPAAGTDANAPTENPEQNHQGDQADQQRPPRGRRDRYGRERRERNDGGESTEREPNSSETPVFSENSVPNEAPAQQIRAQEDPEFVSTEVLAPVFVAPVIQPMAPVQAVQSPAAPAPAPVKAPGVAAPAGTVLPKVASYDLPLQDLAQIAQGSGLQWVNSDASKIAEAQAAIALEAKPAHVPRERPAVVISNEGSLVLVETRRDLREMELPFEKPTA